VRAVTFSGPSSDAETTSVASVDMPRPGAGQVAIEVEAAGLNFIDVMARRGDPGYASAWPYVPRLEVAGTVRAVGEGVRGLAKGQRVAALTRGGGLAEVALADAALTVPLPGGLSAELAAAAPLTLGTALLLLESAARFAPGERVLLHGASGGLGGALAQLVPLLGGGTLIGSVSRDEKRELARRAGYAVALTRDEGFADALRTATDGAGVDIVLDPGGTENLELDLALTAPGGRIVLFGNAGGTAPAPLPALPALIRGNVSIGGFSMTARAAAAPGHVAAALERTLAWLADRSLTLPLTVIAGLGEVGATHQLLAEGRGHGKYVVAL
jgi:NADPH2:quinone reductase